MERQINKRIECYLATLKSDVKTKAEDLEIVNEPHFYELLQYIYDYKPLVLNPQELMKRKRVKNAVYYADRCCAKRANGEQCTRRKRTDDEYCGTHIKGTPHGVCVSLDGSVNTEQKVEVWAQDIQGIIYWIDKHFNVYQAEDIEKSSSNPKIIAKWSKEEDNYIITGLH